MYSYDIIRWSNTVAEETGAATPVVHQDDFIFKFLLNNPAFLTREAAVRYYFRDGKKTAKQLSSLLADEFPVKSLVPTLLEFASGYGCVTRHLVNELAGISITCSDIHPQAMSFIAKHILMVDTLQSHSSPDKFTSPKKYDYVFALSFFSHMPKQTWSRWLKALFEVVSPGGYLMFTTHGLHSSRQFGSPDIPEDGFYFLNDSEQKDLDVEEYGMTLVTPEFALKEIDSCLNSPPTVIKEGFWWGHQDLYVIAKRQDPS